MRYQTDEMLWVCLKMLGNPELSDAVAREEARLQLGLILSNREIDRKLRRSAEAAARGGTSLNDMTEHNAEV